MRLAGTSRGFSAVCDSPELLPRVIAVEGSSASAPASQGLSGSGRDARRSRPLRSSTAGAWRRRRRAGTGAGTTPAEASQKRSRGASAALRWMCPATRWPPGCTRPTSRTGTARSPFSRRRMPSGRGWPRCSPTAPTEGPGLASALRKEGCPISVEVSSAPPEARDPCSFPGAGRWNGPSDGCGAAAGSRLSFPARPPGRAPSRPRSVLAKRGFPCGRGNLPLRPAPFLQDMRPLGSWRFAAGGLRGLSASSRRSEPASRVRRASVAPHAGSPQPGQQGSRTLAAGGRMQAARAGRWPAHARRRRPPSARMGCRRPAS